MTEIGLHWGTKMPDIGSDHSPWSNSPTMLSAPLACINIMSQQDVFHIMNNCYT